MFEYPFEEGDLGPFASRDVLWLKYKLCPLKSCFLQPIVLGVDTVWQVDLFCSH